MCCVILCCVVCDFCPVHWQSQSCRHLPPSHICFVRRSTKTRKAKVFCLLFAFFVARCFVGSIDSTNFATSLLQASLRNSLGPWTQRHSPRSEPLTRFLQAYPCCTFFCLVMSHAAVYIGVVLSFLSRQHAYLHLAPLGAMPVGRSRRPCAAFSGRRLGGAWPR